MQQRVPNRVSALNPYGNFYQFISQPPKKATERGDPAAGSPSGYVRDKGKAVNLYNPQEVNNVYRKL